MKYLIGQNVLILGFRKTGKSVLKHLRKCQSNIFVSDVAKINHSTISSYPKRYVKFLDHQKGFTLTGDFQGIVTSPGIPPRNRLIKKAKALKIPVLTDIELAKKDMSDKFIIAVTGTNGKTTTVQILSQMIPNSCVLGNIGRPFTDFKDKDKILILELSSFQLFYSKGLRVNIGVLLNLSPDHLDWHSDLNEYYQSKFKLFDKQRETDYAVLNYDDQEIRKHSCKTRGKIMWFSTTSPLENGIYFKGEKIFINKEGTEEVLNVENLPLQTQIYLRNFLPCVLVSFLLGVEKKRILRILYEFKGFPHRMEIVDVFEDVIFINDSKSTNPHSTIFALENLRENIVLILGGVEKGLDIRILLPYIKGKVKAIIAIGENKLKIREFFSSTTPVYLAEKMENAVRIGFEVAKPKGVVLLSPACASFDMFRNYEERGEAFKNAVKKLRE